MTFVEGRCLPEISSFDLGVAYAEEPMWVANINRMCRLMEHQVSKKVV